ncbi:MAG TPA: hypothetical protein VFU23_08645 [Gemmatimonadales bacterium]|nr:hypothetical protein [Gemmatimonadales bacterium]
MIYLAKLAKRISRFKSASFVSLAVLAACSKGVVTDYLGPNPTSHTLASVKITPSPATAVAGEATQFSAAGVGTKGEAMSVAVSWSATGGTISSEGLFTATAAGEYAITATVQSAPSVYAQSQIQVTPGAAQIVEMHVSPDQAQVEAGEWVQLSTWATLAGGTVVTSPDSVTWTASGGVVDGAGSFSSSVTGQYVVSAEVPGGARASAVVTVNPSTRILEDIIVTPGEVAVTPGQSLQLTATGNYSNGSSGTPAVLWSATGGTIDGTGHFTAGGTPGTFTATARQWDGSTKGHSTVTITSPTIISIAIFPGSLSLNPGASQQLSASAQLSDGTTQPIAVNWSAQGGSITIGGLYTAGSTPGTFAITARLPGTGLSSSISSTIVINAATLTRVALNPSNATVAAGQTRQFGVSATWSDGSSALPVIGWSATGGSISSGGMFTAGATPCACRVIATATNGVADTSEVTVTAPVMTSLTISPDGNTLKSGDSQQFSATGSWSDGSVSAPSVTWTATGGSINASGVYVAGNLTGTFQVVGKLSGGTKADTALVTIAPATLTAIAVSPEAVSLSASMGKQFSVSGTYSNGWVGVPAVTWSASGGTVTAGGLYTAPAAAGTYKVIASASGGYADTSSVTVTAPATVTSYLLSPASFTVAPGGTRQLSVAAQWSDGASHPFTTSWSATGGTISVSGLYTAGQVTGSFLVIAACTCGVADSSVVTVSAQTAASATTFAINPPAATVQTGATQVFTPVVTWSDGATHPYTVTYTTNGGSVSASGVFTAGMTAGSYKVNAACSCGLSAYADVLVQGGALPPPPPSGPVGGMPNEPAGWTTKIDTPFNTLQDGWVHNGSWNNPSLLRIFTDTNAPQSASAGLEIDYPIGFTDLTSPPLAFKSYTPSDSQYVSTWVMVSKPWQYHTSAVNKLFYLGSNSTSTNDNEIGVVLLGLSEANSHIAVGVQHPSTFNGGTMLGGNIAQPVFTLGVWHRIEILLIQNTGGLRNGTLKIWVDGILTTSYNNMMYNATTDAQFNALLIHPIWGGQGSPPKAENDYIRYDHFHISGH